MKRVSLSLLFLALLVWALSARADDSVEIRKDVAYRADNIDAYQENLCRLDLYLPRERQGVPVLVWLHGGGMTGGDKKGAAPLGRWLAGKGIAVAAADYRLSPRAKYPAYLEDAAQAVAWVRANAADLGIDPARIYVAGHSAGGY
ncbi:MAG TPA: alpha/beta hydrolase, partial [Candidatus Methylacidiphilales bacterium]